MTLYWILFQERLCQVVEWRSAMSAVTRTPPTLQALREHREGIIALAARHGASNVRVFGSVARGDASASSDIDLIVTAGQGVSLFDMVGLWLDLQDLLDCEVSLITDGIDDQRFLRRIQADMVAL